MTFVKDLPGRYDCHKQGEKEKHGNNSMMAVIKK